MKYIIRLVSPAHTIDVCGKKLSFPERSGYYRGDSPWKPVEKGRAEQFSHKEALRVRNHMKQPRIGYQVFIEEV